MVLCSDLHTVTTLINNLCINFPESCVTNGDAAHNYTERASNFFTSRGVFLTF